MKRGVGVSAVTKKQQDAKKFTALGKVMTETKLSSVKEVLGQFQVTLLEFAEKHRNRINSDPEFRMQFHTMCVSVGVDPLASNKGFWADLLGVGDFYFDLGIVITQVCLQTRALNGGVISLNALLDKVKQARQNFKSQDISIDDLKCAIEKLEVLGTGFRIVSTYLLSVPLEMNRDHEDLLSVAQEHGHVSSALMRSLNWSDERFRLAIAPLVSEGIVWLDIHHGQTDYYFPAIAKETTST